MRKMPRIIHWKDNWPCLELSRQKSPTGKIRNFKEKNIYMVRCPMSLSSPRICLTCHRRLFLYISVFNSSIREFAQAGTLPWMSRYIPIALNKYHLSPISKSWSIETPSVLVDVPWWGYKLLRQVHGNFIQCIDPYFSSSKSPKSGKIKVDPKQESICTK